MATAIASNTKERATEAEKAMPALAKEASKT